MIWSSLRNARSRGYSRRALSGGVIETASVGGFVQAGVFSVLNQAYSRQLSLKTKDGLDRRKASGHYACGRVPFGYAYVDGKVVPHPVDWPIARQMFLDLMAVEMNIGGYIRQHKVNWTPQGIKSWIVKPILRGIVTNQAEGVKPLFSDQEWAKASRLLKHRSGSPSRTTTSVRLLTGLVSCAQCQKKLKYKTVKRGAERLHCANPACDWYGRGIRVVIVRQQLVEVLRSAAAQMQAEVERSTETMDHQNSKELNQVRSKIAALEQLQESLVPGLDRSIEILRNELTALSKPVVGPDWGTLSDLLQSPGVLERFSDTELRPLLLEYISQVVYVGNTRDVEIRIRKSP